MKYSLYDIIRLSFHRERESYCVLYKLLGFVPRNIKPYKLALRHSSATAKGRRSSNMHNERLEFLGDSILGAIVSDMVYNHFKREREGFLSNSRSNLVRRQMLNELALEIGLDRLLIVNETGRQHNSYIYGNAFEALVGAIYLDRGYDYCRLFLQKRIFSKLVNLEHVAKADTNFKSQLLEWSQKRRIEVAFNLLEELADKNGPCFVSEVCVNSIQCGIGRGFSKRESQQNASQQALERLHKDSSFIFLQTTELNVNINSDQVETTVIT